MHKLSPQDKKEMAVDRLINTTKSIAQIAHESRMSWMAISKLAIELMSIEPGILEHRKEYAPVELNTSIGPDHDLDMVAWHKECANQSYRRGPLISGPTKSRTRAQANIETLISRYASS